MTPDRYDAVRAALQPAVLLEQLNDMGDIGLIRSGDRGSGRTRLTLSDSDRDARDRLRAWIRELGLEPSVDGIGNIFGVLPGLRDLPPIMAGSHIDTVAGAGALDGTYGVLSGLALIRAFRRAGLTPSRPLAVAAFTNEEGVRFQPDMMGSLVHAGGLPLAAALDARDSGGARLGDELARIGYAGAVPIGALRPAAYFELHVEQGPALEADGLQIGVVEGVQGISWRRIRIEGQSNHAGVTPIRLRHDAGLCAARIVTRLREMAEERGILATVGRLRLEPDMINVIPQRAMLTVDMRHPDEECLRGAEETLDAWLRELAARDGVRIESERLARFSPAPFDPDMVNIVENSARRLGCSYRRMVSGAGHDAQMMARICPAAMIFVPSRGGYSHCPQEDTSPEALSLGLKVLCEAVLTLLARDG